MLGFKHRHHRREPVGDVTIRSGKVVVYVDDKGQPVSTTTVVDNPAAATPAPAPYSEVRSPAQPESPSSGDYGFGSAVTYSPYRDDQFCKTKEGIAKDLAKLGDDYDLIRLYGTDCHQTKFVLEATVGKNVKIFAGIYKMDQLAKEIGELISDVDGDWSRIHAVSVGNELVNKKESTPKQVLDAMQTVKDALKLAKYSGPVVTVDTFKAIYDNIELCKDTPFCAINCHAFFDPHTTPEQAGKFVQDWVDKVAEKSGKPVLVTETGWPTQGDRNGVAVPGKEQQNTAIQSIEKAMPKNKILFNAYNDNWKTDFDGSFKAEHFWGLLGNSPGGS